MDEKTIEDLFIGFGIGVLACLWSYKIQAKVDAIQMDFADIDIKKILVNIVFWYFNTVNKIKTKAKYCRFFLKTCNVLNFCILNKSKQ